jgi:hypothetical protein
MAIGLTPNELNEYVLEEDQEKDRDDPTRTVFAYRTATAHERAKLEDIAGSYDPKGERVEMRMGTSNYLTLRAFLTGWENYLDSHGEAIPFRLEGKQLNLLGKNVDPVTDGTIARVHPDHARELAQAIRDGLRLTKEDVGNSSPPPE